MRYPLVSGGLEAYLSYSPLSTPYLRVRYTLVWYDYATVFRFDGPSMERADSFLRGNRDRRIEPQLVERNCAILHIDGSSIHEHNDLYSAFASVFRKPKGWCGDEQSNLIAWKCSYGYCAEDT